MCRGGGAKSAPPFAFKAKPTRSCQTSAVFAASPLASQVPADDSARVDTVRKLFVVGRMEEFHAQMLQMALDRYAQVPALAPYAEPMREFFKKHGSFAAIEADMMLPELMRELGHPKPPGQQPGSGT